MRNLLTLAIFHEPKVIFLDEPTAGLDPEASLMVREMIVRLKGEGRTIVVCTHNLDEAQRLADIVGIINGRLLVCDTLANLQSGAGLTTSIEIELGEPERFQERDSISAVGKSEGAKAPSISCCWLGCHS